MRITSQEISVESSVLKWARVTIGKSIGDVARRLDLSESVVEKWENGEKRPTLKQLRDLSTFYKRPLAVFFLAAPPADAPIPTDFRTLPKTVKKPFSEKTLLAMRRARRLQTLANDLSKTLDREFHVDVGQATLSDDPRTLAMRVRERMGVVIEEQFKWKNEGAALAEWRHRVEESGVLIFEIPFPLEEGRAFSFADTEQPVVVLNSNDRAINGRIFSLFHEYAHLLLRQSGICDWTEQGKVVEQFCNRFAGEFLVPRQALLADSLVRAHGKAATWDEEELQHIAKQFKVSREVILRRLLVLGRTTERFYKHMHEGWERKLKETMKSKRGKRIPPRQCVRQNGIPFTSLVLESAREEKITYRDVSDYLSIGLKHLATVESLLREERVRYG
jgi:Zn-dependent peptidase ImmA (M78 family)